jgi:hypothetical protein
MLQYGKALSADISFFGELFFMDGFFDDFARY